MSWVPLGCLAGTIVFTLLTWWQPKVPSNALLVLVRLLATSYAMRTAT